jgi:hypothetical protein
VADGRDKYQTDEIRARIRHILMHEWDPIGVPGLPVDEYDRYIAKIYLMLLNARTNRQRIANHLLGIATVSMGLSDRPARRERVQPRCYGANVPAAGNYPTRRNGSAHGLPRCH